MTKANWKRGKGTPEEADEVSVETTPPVAEPQADNAQPYVFRVECKHTTASGRRLHFCQGDRAKGLSAGEIRNFLANGIIEEKTKG